MASDDGDLNQFTCLYFGFASNLSPRSIQQRCPGSLYVGLAVLKGWKFVISEVGFGNIVPGAADDEVWGTLSFLTAQHEAALDKSEEIDWWHQKQKVKVRRVTPLKDSADSSGSQEGDGDKVEATTYIDVKRTGEGVISKEYLVWMRKAIEDGLQIGVPKSYVDKYMKKYLPENEDVGREEKIMMLRTIQFNKEDLGYVPTQLRSIAERR